MPLCPCGSNNAYETCCKPVISGEKKAETAEQLMRARYSAYVHVETDFLFNSTHPAHRKGYDHDATREWAADSDWNGLEIVHTVRGGIDDATGEVEFVARYRNKGLSREHHEVAQFRKEQGEWLFTDGKPVAPQPIISNKIGRNEPCTCGSGQKYKKCCGK